MKCTVKPLEGKYYGTVIEVANGKATTEFEIHSGIYGEPSEREINRWFIETDAGVKRKATQEDWDNNIPIKDGWGGFINIQAEDRLCDGHYESKATYELAKEIEEKLNK